MMPQNISQKQMCLPDVLNVVNAFQRIAWMKGKDDPGHCFAFQNRKNALL